MLARIYRWIVPDDVDVMPQHHWPYYVNWDDAAEWRWGYFVTKW